MQGQTWSCLCPSWLWIPFWISSMESRGDCLFSWSGLRRDYIYFLRHFRFSTESNKASKPQSQILLRTNIPPLWQHVIFLVLPQLDRNLAGKLRDWDGKTSKEPTKTSPRSFSCGAHRCPCLCSWSSSACSQTFSIDLEKLCNRLTHEKGPRKQTQY